MTSNGPMGGWMAVRICVCVRMFHVSVPNLESLQRDKSPSLPDVNKNISWSKKLRNFDWPLRGIKSEVKCSVFSPSRCCVELCACSSLEPTGGRGGALGGNLASPRPDQYKNGVCLTRYILDICCEELIDLSTYILWLTTILSYGLSKFIRVNDATSGKR
jgi:hypothetical protein